MTGMAEDMKRAAAGMQLFAEELELDVDTSAAEAFKAMQDAAIKSKEEEANGLTGKDNKKPRSELGKQVSAMKADPKYVDACKVLKGLAPPHGNFSNRIVQKPVASETQKEEEEVTVDVAKKDKAKPKKVESAGLSRAERDELEKLKSDLMARKAELKAQGMSGGQCNKDEQVVAWVARMTELKIREDPSLADGGKEKKDKPKKGKGSLSSSEQIQLEKLKGELEIYRQKLVTEFGYSKKDIAADPDFKEQELVIKQMEGRA